MKKIFMIEMRYFGRVFICKYLTQKKLHKLLFGSKVSSYLCGRFQRKSTINMNITSLVEALDKQILEGDIIGAFANFAADDCVTYSHPNHKTTNKTQKLETLAWFFAGIEKTVKIERQGVQVNGDESRSQFTFEFTGKSGEPIAYSEVIRRAWKDGKLIEEQYLIGQTLETKAEAPKAPAKASATTTTKAAPKEDKNPATTPAKAVSVTEKPKLTKSKTAAKDDLTKIEGIGPKIAELLQNSGIDSYAKLADTKPQDIKTILDAAGKRYQMHDPATWPQQAALARDGKTVELKKLQDELKGGRK